MNDIKFNRAEREVLHSVPGKSVHMLVGGTQYFIVFGEETEESFM